jgi:hypothetical protein
MSYYISIQPINVGPLQEKQANAITWQVNGLIRGAESAVADCALIKVNPDGSSEHAANFQVPIDNSTLQAWGADDSVIDNVVLAYSPLFIPIN